MRTYQVEVKVTPWEKGGYLAEVPVLQGCWVVADTISQALEDIVEVIQMHIELRKQLGEPLPPEVEGMSPSVSSTAS